MGIFNRKKKIKNSATSITLDELHSFLIGRDYYPQESEALKLSAVYAAINTISTTFSKIPWFIVNRYTKERIDYPQLYNLLNIAPNDKMNASVLHGLLSRRSLYTGEAYAIPVRGYRSTDIQQLIPLPLTNVTKCYDENNVLYYRVAFDKENTKIYRYDEIVHLKDMTLNGVDGLSPLTYARHTIQVGLNQETYSEDFYASGGRPSDYLKTNTDLGSRGREVPITRADGTKGTVYKSGKDLMREEWEKGKNKKFFTAILDNGLEYGTVDQISPQDMDFVNSKDINVQDIARFFGMGSCMFKLGVGKQSYSTNEQGQICYINETIAGRLRQWEQEFTLKLLTQAQRDKGWVIKGNLNAELRGDMTTRANFYDKMRSMGIYNINEMRALEDLPSIGEIGDTRLIGANSIPLERLIDGQTAAQVTPNDLDESNEE